MVVQKLLAGATLLFALNSEMTHAQTTEHHDYPVPLTLSKDLPLSGFSKPAQSWLKYGDGYYVLMVNEKDMNMAAKAVYLQIKNDNDGEVTPDEIIGTSFKVHDRNSAMTHYGYNMVDFMLDDEGVRVPDKRTTITGFSKEAELLQSDREIKPSYERAVNEQALFYLKGF